MPTDPYFRYCICIFVTCPFSPLLVYGVKLGLAASQGLNANPFGVARLCRCVSFQTFFPGGNGLILRVPSTGPGVCLSASGSPSQPPLAS